MTYCESGFVNAFDVFNGEHNVDIFSNHQTKKVTQTCAAYDLDKDLLVTVEKDMIYIARESGNGEVTTISTAPE